jgi:formamidopyrimidine-DNA glycosylase
MPELPELEVVKEVLQRRVVGQTIQAVRVFGGGSAIIVRDLTQQGFGDTLTGSSVDAVARRGKFLIFTLGSPADPVPSASVTSAPLPYLMLNPKLTGRLQLAAPTERRMPKTHLALTLSSGVDLRYVDQRTMGQIYLTHALDQVPGYAGLGPEPFEISLDEFRSRLKKFHGEIKGILVRGPFIAGIGNAYADEILWAAGLNPFRKRTQLTSEEIDRLYEAMGATLREATGQVRAEMGEAIHLKPREFLAVHMKSGQPCPRCGSRIALVGANQRITNFCRTCQPGGSIEGL